MRDDPSPHGRGPNRPYVRNEADRRFERHMSPGTIWIEDPAFAKAFAEIVGEEYMTTSVTINAHAWPVLVATRQGEPGQERSIHTLTVEPGTERTIYIYSGLQIVSIEEQPMRTHGFEEAPATRVVEAEVSEGLSVGEPDPGA